MSWELFRPAKFNQSETFAGAVFVLKDTFLGHCWKGMLPSFLQRHSEESAKCLGFNLAGSSPKQYPKMQLWMSKSGARGLGFCMSSNKNWLVFPRYQLWILSDDYEGVAKWVGGCLRTNNGSKNCCEDPQIVWTTSEWFSPLIFGIRAQVHTPGVSSDKEHAIEESDQFGRFTKRYWDSKYSKHRKILDLSQFYLSMQP